MKPARNGAPAPAKGPVAVLVGTRKGAFILKGDRARRSWKVSAPIFLGSIVHHFVADPRDRRTLLVAARTGHLGPTVFRSTDLGRTWKEASRPPAFPKVTEGQPGNPPGGNKGRVVDHTFWLTPGHASEKATWYAGTSPQGLFRSADGGDTWEPMPGYNDDPRYRGWMGRETDGTPDGPVIHSILVDPRDPTHLYLGMSSGGVHESLDAGRSWNPIIDGMEVVEQLDPSNVAFHDPHTVKLCATNPDRLYQQNHCGIYRLDRPGTRWERVGRNMPKAVGDIGFPIVVHPRDDSAAWVFPMDGSGVWPRTSPAGKPAAYVTRNAGSSWKRLDGGMPRRDAWWTVKRQAMAGDAREPVGLYLGTTQGEVWASRDEGARWACIARGLPEIYSVETVEIGR